MLIVNIIVFFLIFAFVLVLAEIIARCCDDTLWRKSKEGTIIFDRRDGYFVISCVIIFVAIWIIKKIVSVI